LRYRVSLGLACAALATASSAFAQTEVRATGAAPVLSPALAAPTVVPGLMLTNPAQLTGLPLELPHLAAVANCENFSWFTNVASAVMSDGRPLLVMAAPSAISISKVGANTVGYFPMEKGKPHSLGGLPEAARKPFWDRLMAGVESGDYSAAHSFLQSLFDGTGDALPGQPR
jgi:hypothetical protein